MMTTILSWMLTYLIHSTILILSVWLLCRGIKPIASRLSPSAENLAWKLALVGAFVTASVQIGAGVRPAIGAFELGTGPEVVERAKVEEIEQIRPRLVVVPNHEPVIVDERDVMMLGTGPIPTASIGVPEAPAAAEVSVEPAPSWPKLILLAWAIGAALALIRLGLSARALRKRLRDRGPVLEDPVLESFLTLCRDAEVRRKIELSQSTRIASPIALWRKEIVVPERAVNELSPAAMRSVLAHELAHLERRDPHWLAFGAVLEALCFFQPLNRLARRGMQESAELLCDDWAIAHTGDGVAFAKSLAEVATWQKANRSSLLLAGMISGERPLVRRVKRALEGDPQRFEADDGPRPARMLLGLGALAALIMVAPGAVDASPPESEVEVEQEPPSKREQRAQRRAQKDAEKALEAAEKARQKAEEARLKAEAAEREAARKLAEAQRAAAEAQRQATAPVAPMVPMVPGNGPYVIIRDGDDILVIDENGLRLRSKDADIDIDAQGPNPQMRMRVREGDQELDFGMDVETLMELLGEVDGMNFGGMDFGDFEDFEDFQWGFDEEQFEQQMREFEREFERQFEREFRHHHAPQPPAPPHQPHPPAPPAPGGTWIPAPAPQPPLQPA